MTWLDSRRRQRDRLDRAAAVSAIPLATEPAESSRISVKLSVPSEDPVEFVRELRWPHIQTGDPVSCYNEITADFLDNRSVCRFDHGQLVAGSDIVGKPRRVQLTCCSFSLITYLCLRRPNTRGVTLLQSGQAHIVDPVLDDLRLMLDWLPPEWALAEGPDGIIRRVALTGRTIRFPNGSTHRIMLSGSTASSAARVGRAGRLDFVHASEAAYYQHAATTMTSALKALDPKCGQAIVESTFQGSAENWHAAEFARSRLGIGRFSKAHFWPWYRHPLKRISASNPDFARYLGDDFPVPAGDLEQEERLGLDAEQRAFRRSIYCVGTAEDRRKEKAENPERWDDAFVGSGARWLVEDTRLLLEARTGEPLEKRQVGTLTVSIWHRTSHRLLFGADPAEHTGVDFTGVVAYDPVERRVVATIHGRGLASEVADCMASLIAELCGGVRNWGRYQCNVERNKGKALIAELEKRGVHQYTTQSRESGTKLITVFGTVTSGASRAVMVDLVGDAVKRLDEISSPQLCTELGALVVADGKVQAPTAKGADGKEFKTTHDDLFLALALALYAAERLPGAMSTASKTKASPLPASRRFQLPG